jgi:hypothetical protein
MNRLLLFKDIIGEKGIFDVNNIIKVINKEMEEELCTIPARPFLWDASERNVIIHQGKISGIVDVDDLCFGDPLFVLALTYVALEIDGHDSLYADYWAQGLHLDKKAQCRLEFYRLFYTILFMRKQSMKTNNQQIVKFDERRLEDLFQQSLLRIRDRNER